MIEWIKENSIAFTIAVILHLLFIGALLFNWEYDKPKQIVLKQGDVIQTTAVDANSFNAKIEQIEQKKEQQKKAEQQRKAAEERNKKALKEKKRREELKRKEEQKRKKAEAARKKEQQRKAALLKEKKLKEQKLKEQKRKEAEKKAAEEKRKKEEARKKAEARKAEAQKAEEKKRKEAEQKRKEEQKRIAEQKRKEQQRRKAEAEKKRQAELRRQQERERAERERLSRGIVNKYVALIAQKIERNWRQPLDAPRDLQCKIDIRLRSNGDVLNVQIAESSGNAAFDRSVITAVRRASPLPVPKDSVIFKEFEVMRLRFEPGSH